MKVPFSDPGSALIRHRDTPNVQTSTRGPSLRAKIPTGQSWQSALWTGAEACLSQKSSGLGPSRRSFVCTRALPTRFISRAAPAVGILGKPWRELTQSVSITIPSGAPRWRRHCEYRSGRAWRRPISEPGFAPHRRSRNRWPPGVLETLVAVH